MSKFSHFRANLVEFRAEKVLFCLYHTALWLKCKILYQIAKIKVCKSTPSLGLLAYFPKIAIKFKQTNIHSSCLYLQNRIINLYTWETAGVLAAE